MNKFRLFYTIILAIALVTWLMSGCQATAANQTQDQQDQTINSQLAGSNNENEKTRPESAVLRLNRGLTTDLNPYLDHSTAGQAAHSLIFNSLFSRQENGERVAELVDQYSYNREKLQLTLTIKADQYFHDQDILMASDVLADLNFLKQHPESIYASGLSSYQNAFLTQERTLVIQLAFDDPAFLDALTFPVVQADELNLLPGSLLSGTGRYRMNRLDEQGQLWLAWADDSSLDSISLRQIVLKPFADARSAMRAMEEDQLDLVYLPVEDLIHYQTRNSLRLDRFASPIYVDLLVNSSLFKTDRSSTDLPVIPNALRQLFASSQWFSYNLAWPGQSADIPVRANHLSLGGVAFTLLQDKNDSSPAIDDLSIPRSRLINILVNESDTLSVLLGKQLQKWLEGQALMAEIQAFPELEYQSQLSQFNYDFAIRQTYLPASGNPESFYFNSANTLQGLMLTHPNSYDDYLKSWQTFRPLFGYLNYSEIRDPDQLKETTALFRDEMTALTLQSNSIGILFREAAVAYGDRVEGQVQPSWQQPYKEIEDLWIWSGLSQS